MKLIIEIEKDYYEIIKYKVEHGDDYKPYSLIANGTPYEERTQGCKKHCNTCVHFQQLTKIQELGYCETKNYHVSANSDKCIDYEEKQ